MALLEINNLKKSYVSPAGERASIIDVPHFEMNAGAQLGLRGSSGSGKTTFLNLIAGILRPDAGIITLAGVEITALPENKMDCWRGEQIGYVFQTFNLLQGFTALENVELSMRFGRGLDTQFARRLLERVGLQERLHYRPGQLSVGQQQRVAVARALANQPQLVLADEPTGSLDRQRAQEALALMREICREHNAALLLVSHDPEVQRQFDHVEQLSRINRAATV